MPVRPPLLVEVVTDPGPVGQQVLHRHPVVDERQVRAPSSDRARVVRWRAPCSTRLITANAVKPLAPLAIANWVSTLLGIS